MSTADRGLENVRWITDERLTFVNVYRVTYDSNRGTIYNNYGNYWYGAISQKSIQSAASSRIGVQATCQYYGKKMFGLNTRQTTHSYSDIVMLCLW